MHALSRSPSRRLVESAQGAWLTVDGCSVLNLCSNNYLGFADAPELKAAAVAAIERFGTGVGGARSISGTQPLHLRLEARLAEFKGVAAAMLLTSGFLANLAVIPALVGRADVVFSDELNHASIVDACRLSGAEIVRYPHADVAALGALLRQNGDGKAGRRLIVTDGVFSMDGELAPLDRLAALAAETRALLVVDDAHGEGVVGRGGRGVVDHFDVRSAVTAEIGTLSKAFGVVGGYVAGSAEVVEAMRSKARPYLFSTGLPPADTAAALAAVERLMASDEAVLRLWSNARRLRAALQALELEVLGETPIIPVVLGTEERAREVAERLFEAGVYVVPIGYPMVPRGRARIRLIVSAAHSEADMDLAAAALERALRAT
jgi:glycine C-acetyltransferase